MLYRYHLLNRTAQHSTAHDYWAPIRQIFSGDSVCYLMTIYHFLLCVMLNETHKCDRKGLPVKTGNMYLGNYFKMLFRLLTTRCYWTKCVCNHFETE